tara:strand:+ start:712 stop:1185 length:474 start_codon:yes stop_codon:yes gene_type:complete
MIKIFKKFLIPFLFLVFLNSCSTGGNTGSAIMGQEQSPIWFATASESDIHYFYDSKTTSKLCIIWQSRYPGTKMSTTIRSEISDALERRGENGLRCSDSSSDSTNISNAKIKKMEKRAMCAARRAEWRSMCATGDYISVNGVSCYGRWSNYLQCGID